MNIAVYHNLPSGGAKRTLFEQLRRLATNHTLDVYTLSCADHDFADIRPFSVNHRVYPFEPSTPFHSPWGRLNQGLRLADLLRLRKLTRRISRDIEAGSYDVAFVHGCQFEKAPSLLHHLQTLPKVYYCQEGLRHLYETMPSRPYETRSTLRNALDRIDPLIAAYHHTLKRFDRHNLGCATRILVNSKYSQSEVQRIYGLQAEVSYLGVDTEQFRPLETARGDFILSVGSLTPLKGFDFLIRAVACLAADRRPELVIVSNFQNAPERAYLETMAAGLNVRLQLRSGIDDDQLVQLYNQAQLTAYAPIREPFGLVTLESMACGTAVVGVREGGVLETVIHGKTGLLTDRDPAQFAAAIDCLLTNRTLAGELGRNGRNHVLQNWTWPQSVAAVERHLAVPPVTQSLPVTRLSPS